MLCFSLYWNRKFYGLNTRTKSLLDTETTLLKVMFVFHNNKMYLIYSNTKDSGDTIKKKEEANQKF